MEWEAEAEAHLRIILQAERQRRQEEIAALIAEREALRAERDSLRPARRELGK